MNVIGEVCGTYHVTEAAATIDHICYYQSSVVDSDCYLQASLSSAAFCKQCCVRPTLCLLPCHARPQPIH